MRLIRLLIITIIAVRLNKKNIRACGYPSDRSFPIMARMSSGCENTVT